MSQDSDRRLIKVCPHCESTQFSRLTKMSEANFRCFDCDEEFHQLGERPSRTEKHCLHGLARKLDDMEVEVDYDRKPSDLSGGGLA